MHILFSSKYENGIFSTSSEQLQQNNAYVNQQPDRHRWTPVHLIIFERECILILHMSFHFIYFVNSLYSHVLSIWLRDYFVKGSGKWERHGKFEGELPCKKRKFSSIFLLNSQKHVICKDYSFLATLFLVGPEKHNILSVVLMTELKKEHNSIGENVNCMITCVSQLHHLFIIAQLTHITPT